LLALAAATAIPAWAQNLETYTDVASVRKLDTREAAKGHPVRVRGVLTHFDHDRNDCFFQDATAGIWLDAGTEPRPMRQGDLVEVTGFTAKGAFAAMIRDPQFRVLGRGRMPKPHLLPYLDLGSAKWDSQWVELRGRVRTANFEDGILRLWLAPAGHRFPIAIPAPAAGTPEQYVGAVVRARGVCATLMNLHDQTTGFLLHVPSTEYLKITEPAPKTPWAEPETSLDDTLRFIGLADTRKWVRVRGVVTLRIPGRSLFITADKLGLRIQTPQRSPALVPGDEVEVLGFPALGETTPFLEDAIYRKVGHRTPPAGERISAKQALQREADDQLVQIDARLLSRMDTAQNHMMAFRSGDVAFFAELRNKDSEEPPVELREGSRVRVTGLCQIRIDQSSQPLRTFHLLLRSPRDLQVLEQPPWLTTERTVLILSIMAALILAAAVWAAVLRRRVRAQTTIIVRRLEAEAALEKRFSDMVENANDMIYTRNLAGALTALNPAGERITGYTRSEAIGMNLLQLAVPERREEFQARMEQTHRGTGLEADEVEIVRKDGQRRTLEFSPRLIVKDGIPLGVEGIARDVTERKRVQVQFAAAKEMAEAANRAKSDFLANMSHEIRTPMNGVIGMSELVLETQLTPEQREYVDTIRACAESLLAVINDILDFSKIEARKLELECLDFDIRKLLDDIGRSMRVRVAQKGLALRLEVDPDVPGRLRGDPDRVRQIVVNLVGNALKFTERGEIAVGVTSQHLAGDRCELHCAVRDTGIGISPQKQRAIFLPFEQADGSTSRRHGGTGLGLAICSQLVALMHGAIWVESEPGQGSTFHFTAQFILPEDRPPAAEARTAGAEQPLAALHVLVVEDNAVNSMLAARMLERRGHSVQVAQNGRAALDALELAHFDLVLMDLQMPEMDGFQATAAIREREHSTGSRVPILALTAHAMKGDRERCLEAGMDGYVAKPVQAAEMFSAIESLLRHLPNIDRE
jgi:PAS domain S-box-containing protein